MEKYPNFQITELTKLIGKEWRDLPEEKKNHYREMTEKEN